MFQIERRMAIVLSILAAATLVAGFFAYRTWQARQTAKTEATLSRNQTGAAVESGRDAVNTVGNQQAVETARTNQVKEGQDAIDQAPRGDSNDAADRATCKLRSYRNQPRCVALLGPVAK